MTNRSLFDALNEFDFTDGKRYEFKYRYDIRLSNDADLLDNDCADAASCVERFGLSHDIDARHRSTVVNGDRTTDEVDVRWEFWREQ